LAIFIDNGGRDNQRMWQRNATVKRKRMGGNELLMNETWLDL